MMKFCFIFLFLPLVSVFADDAVFIRPEKTMLYTDSKLSDIIKSVTGHPQVHLLDHEKNNARIQHIAIDGKKAWIMTHDLSFTRLHDQSSDHKKPMEKRRAIRQYLKRLFR
ncbi:MAG: hypothetical protein KAQ98_12490 [Bacteriovoracaceae bacterium]|nr:hypothetical protein [Bacteriovoracaceae bacterium]